MSAKVKSEDSHEKFTNENLMATQTYYWYMVRGMEYVCFIGE